MAPKKPVPRLDQVVGENVKRIRLEEGWTRDQVASQGWFVGLPWSHSTLTELEAGRRTISVAELVLLALTIDKGVNELLAGEGHALLGDGSEVPLSEIRDVLAGEVKDPGIVRMRIHVGRRQKYDRAMLSASGEAEQKAARSFRVTPQTIAEAAYDLWRRSLTDERNARVEEELGETDSPSPRRIQALRGHVTRRLLSEIENLISANPGNYPTLEEDRD